MVASGSNRTRFGIEFCCDCDAVVALGVADTTCVNRLFICATVLIEWVGCVLVANELGVVCARIPHELWVNDTPDELGVNDAPVPNGLVVADIVANEL